MARDLTLEENWVVVTDDNQVHEFKTFKEALKGPNGHLMSKVYYEYHYKNI